MVMVGTQDAAESAVAEEFDYYGSNVDLEIEIGNVQRELAARAALQDEAFKVYQDSSAELVAAKRDLRLFWGPALAKHYKRTGNVTIAKSMAEQECRSHLAKVDAASSTREVALSYLRMLQSQLTAAQTRAKIWQAQFDVEGRTGPR